MADNLNCSLCLSHVDPENAEVLTMGAYGTPKLLCEECSKKMETVVSGREYSEIKEAMDNLTKKISDANIDDRRVLDTMHGIFDAAAERAAKIKDGSYDFSLDEAEEEGLLDIPEELEETEEDKLLDQRDATIGKRMDTILTWASVGVIIAAVGFLIYYFLS